MNFFKNFASTLRVTMASQGFTQLSLAKKTGIKQSAISTYCQGKGLPNVESLYLLSKALSVSMEFLLTGLNNQKDDKSDPHQSIIELRLILDRVAPLIIEAKEILSLSDSCIENRK